MSSRLQHFWIALTTSFLFASPYFQQFLSMKNRLYSFWTRWDGLAILCATLVPAIFFFFVYRGALRCKSPWVKKSVEFAFILLLGSAIIEIVRSNLGKLGLPPEMIETVKIVSQVTLWLILSCLLAHHLFSKKETVKKGLRRLCLVVSPVIPVFLMASLTYKTWQPCSGQLSFTESKRSAETAKPHIFIFLFDEWEYARTFHNKTAAPHFQNVARIEETSLVFHNAYSPQHNTSQSMPCLFFQKGHEFIFRIDDKIQAFQHATDRNYFPLDNEKSVFDYARENGYRTFLFGNYLPYAEFLRNRVDVITSKSMMKMLGDNFFQVTAYHLFKISLLYTSPILPKWSKAADSAVENRYQIHQTQTIHDLAFSVIKNSREPTFAFFHYPIPHPPYIFARGGPKNLFKRYEMVEQNYLDSLDYMDQEIGKIIDHLKANGKFDNSLLIFLSDHAWKKDPSRNLADLGNLTSRHVPLLIKFPRQNKRMDVDQTMVTSELLDYIRRYAKELDPEITL
ncbi:MAG: sulfatase-like hydrolase/transferase [Candidatus Omnitrophica bacterium]|nr:sulfatase-like hydrolase/transferase [Candidatus Omnitrophota bacterium]